jgi:hypothetical protein
MVALSHFHLRNLRIGANLPCKGIATEHYLKSYRHLEECVSITCSCGQGFHGTLKTGFVIPRYGGLDD